MSGPVLLKNAWKESLAALLASAKTEVIIASPFVTREGIDFVLSEIASHFRATGHLTFVTNLSPRNQVQGVTDPNALQDLTAQLPVASIYHLSRLHAKTYVSDTQAIVTSGNLTTGGLTYNHEYGVLLTDISLVSEVRSDMLDYAQLGAFVSRAQLEVYCSAANEAATAFQQQQVSVSRSARRRFEQALQAASDELIRLQLAEGAMHTVFEKTVLYLLRRYGSLSTQQLYGYVQQIHPDLCDDTIDRVIDGRNFGKKWKHAMRTSQQQLKRKDMITLRDGRWYLVDGAE